MNNSDFLIEDDFDFLEELSANAHDIFLKRINMTPAKYDKLCQPYLEECGYYKNIYEEQSKLALHYEKTLLPTSVKQEYSVGGETIHRGFYCPSLIKDIVIGNCKRGRLCKSGNKKITHIYHFDNNHKIIVIKQDDGIEYITYDNNNSLGISYDDENGIQKICQCKYNNLGKIEEYSLAFFSNGKIEQLDKEIYTYSSDSVIVEESSLLILNSFKDEPVQLNLNKYIFTVENGYLTNYITDVFYTENISNQPIKERMRKITIKRKV